MRSVSLVILAAAVPSVLAISAWRGWWAPTFNRAVAQAAHGESAPAPIGEPRTKAVPPAAFAATATRPSVPSVVDLVDAWRERLQKLSRDNPDAQQAAAMVLIQQDRHELALKIFDRLLLRRPNDSAILLGKALALTGLGRHEDALPLFASLARLEPDSIPTRYGYAVGLMRCGEHAEAARVFEAILQQQPDHARARFNLAILRQGAGRHLEALDLWRGLTAAPTSAASGAETSDASVVLDPPMLADAWFHRGEMALETNHLKEAETCFLNAANLSGRDAAAWCNLGIVRARQFRRDDATTALERALDCDPHLLPALNQLAYIHAANFRDTGAESHSELVLDLCRRSLDLQPNQPNIRALRQAILSCEAEDETQRETDNRP